MSPCLTCCHGGHCNESKVGDYRTSKCRKFINLCSKGVECLSRIPRKTTKEYECENDEKRQVQEISDGTDHFQSAKLVWQLMEENG